MKCDTVGCYKRFSQKQALSRHVQSLHLKTTESIVYYHCTTDGCKYASTGQEKHKFHRLDQLKEHIKDYGHYGPHSAHDRKRRPGIPLFSEYQIPYFIEAWAHDGNSQGKREIRSFTFDSLKTKLWHTDDIGPLYIWCDESTKTDGLNYCTSLEDCYYKYPDTLEGLRTIHFKSAKDAENHMQRAHGLKAPAAAPLSAFFVDHPLTQENDSDESKSWYINKGSHSAAGISTTSSEYHWDQYTQVANEDLLPNWLVNPLDLASSTDFLGTGALFSNEAYSTLSSRTPELKNVEHLVPGNTFSSVSSAVTLVHPTPTKQTPLVTSSTQYYGELAPARVFSQTPSESSGGASRSSRNNSTFPCHEIGCSRMFTRNADLRRHSKSFHGTLNLRCSICQRGYSRVDKVREHMKNVHKRYPGATSARSSLSVSEKAPEAVPQGLMSSPIQMEMMDIDPLQYTSDFFELVDGKSIERNFTNDTNQSLDDQAIAKVSLQLSDTWSKESTANVSL